MADNKVNFLRGTSSEYEAATKDNDTFYYTTDDGKLYLGNKEITGGNITVDDALSDTSENPVQNKVINAAVDAKIDKIKTVSVMITTTGWLSDDDIKYPFYYDIPVPEATAYDRADVHIKSNSIEAALTAGFDTKTDTQKGYIRIRAKQAPTAVISAEYQIFGGAV